MKKIYTFFALLLLCAVTAVAQTYTINVGKDYGTYYRDGTTATTTQWSKKWVSTNTNPQVTLTTSANNWNASNDLWAPWNAITISVDKPYIITGYKIVGQENDNSAQYGNWSLTDATTGTSATFIYGTENTLNVTGLSAKTATINTTGTNSNSYRLKYSTFEIYVEDDPNYVPPITSWSEIKPTSTYTFKTSGRGSWYDDGSLGCGGETVGEFAFVPYKGKNYLYSVSSKKFMCHEMASGVTSNNNRVQMKDTDLALLIDGFTFSSTNNSEYPIAISDTKGYMFNIGGSGNMVVNTWTSFDAGNQLQVEEANTSFNNSEATALLDAYFDISITYVYKFNDTEVGRETLPATVGEAFPTPTYSAPYGFTFEAPTGTFTEADDDTEKDIALTWTLFDYADSFDNISQWYNVRLHSSQNNYLYNNNGAPAFTGTVGKNDYLWGFVGDPINGFQVYSYTAGGSVAIDNATPSALSANGTSVNFKVTNGNTGTQGSTADFTFAMYATVGSYLNYQSGNIARWSSNDEGSTFMLNAATISTVEEEYEQLLALLETYPYGANVNQYSVVVEEQDYTSQMATIIEDLKKQGYSETNMANAQALFNGMSLNMPQAGFYRIKGKTSGKYVAGTKTNDGSKFNMSDAVDATTIFYYSGTKLISYSTGMENGMTGNVWAWNYDGEGATVVFQDGLTLGGYAIQSGGNGNFYDAGTTADRGRDVTINASTNTCYTSWYLEPVTELPITLRRTSDDTPYFATFSAPVPVRIEGATLCSVEVSESGKSINYTATTDTQLAAENGVLLTGESGSATATIITETVETVDYGLQAYSAAFTVAEADQTSKLFLGKGSQSGKAGFYKLGSAKTNGFKAYFVNTTTGEAKEGFDLVDANETTGVESIDNSQFAIDNAPVYNLQGQRVNKAQKGVFIQNGKKVVVK